MRALRAVAVAELAFFNRDGHASLADAGEIVFGQGERCFLVGGHDVKVQSPFPAFDPGIEHMNRIVLFCRHANPHYS